MQISLGRHVIALHSTVSTLIKAAFLADYCPTKFPNLTLIGDSVGYISEVRTFAMLVLLFHPNP